MLQFSILFPMQFRFKLGLIPGRTHRFASGAGVHTCVIVRHQLAIQKVLGHAADAGAGLQPRFLDRTEDGRQLTHNDNAAPTAGEGAAETIRALDVGGDPSRALETLGAIVFAILGVSSSVFLWAPLVSDDDVNKHEFVLLALEGVDRGDLRALAEGSFHF